MQTSSTSQVGSIYSGVEEVSVAATGLSVETASFQSQGRWASDYADAQRTERVVASGESKAKQSGIANGFIKQW